MNERKQRLADFQRNAEELRQRQEMQKLASQILCSGVAVQVYAMTVATYYQAAVAVEAKRQQERQRHRWWHFFVPSCLRGTTVDNPANASAPSNTPGNNES